MIPDWLPNGDLPLGVHFASMEEVRVRFAFNARRHRLFEGFLDACLQLKAAGCELVYLDGSFVTSKVNPNDFDACWDIRNVDDEVLDPVFFEFSNARERQKQRFEGELFPAQLPEGATGRAFVHFFQTNKRTGEAKGIVAIRLMAEVNL